VVIQVVGNLEGCWILLEVEMVEIILTIESLQ
jgi:hypothetical protein